MSQGSRACGILSIRGPEVSLGLPRVVTIHAQAPTPHAPQLPAYFGQFSHSAGRRLRFRRSWMKTGLELI